MTGSYEDAFNRSISDPEGFWGEAAEGIHWFKKWDKVLDDTNKPFYRWFSGGIVNTCYNALDRHVEGGRADQLALIYDSPVTGNTVRTYTYRQLRDEVAAFAGVLVGLGVGKGDRVIVYMPMVPEAPIAMLACARIGAVHSVVFGGFASNELAVRIDDALPKAIVTASCGIEVGRVIDYKPLIEGAIALSDHKPDAVIIKQRPQNLWELQSGQYDWDESAAKATPAECVPVAATDPLYILYTSGTTGQPKGVVRDNGGHLVALNWSMKNIYDVEPGEVWWAASDVGWVVGHSYIVYAPLIYGATTVVYEGKPVGTPDAGAFWRMIEQHNVVSLFTAPTAFRAIKRDDPKAELMAKYDLSKFRILFLAGERTDPDTLQWAMNAVKRPVIDHWWQTETGWAIAANCMGLDVLPVKPGSPTRPVPGWNVMVLDEANKEVGRGQSGTICVKLPLPPGALPTLWNNDDRFVKSYLTEFPGYYTTADAGFMDEDGYVYIMARTDDVINVAGHRLSTGAMEEVLARHDDVAECAVVGVYDNFKGQLPVGFVVLKAGVSKSHEQIVKELVKMVRDQIGPVAAFKTATVIDRLPKTRSGKILRGTIQKIADNEPWKMPATIDDPAILDEIKGALEQIGYASARKEAASSPAE
ncbi:MAG: propionyl-CoA synthetase [Rhodospirillales bacterium]|nr:propionyl-CoA synthetase [Rhodospirillales bacterium]